MRLLDIDREPGLADAEEVAGAVAAESMPPLKQGDAELIIALLKTRNKQAAAVVAGVARATLYRRLGNPTFRAAYRAAQDLYLREGTWNLLGRLQQAYARRQAERRQPRPAA